MQWYFLLVAIFYVLLRILGKRKIVGEHFAFFISSFGLGAWSYLLVLCSAFLFPVSYSQEQVQVMQLPRQQGRCLVITNVEEYNELPFFESVSCADLAPGKTLLFHRNQSWLGFEFLSDLIVKKELP